MFLLVVWLEIPQAPMQPVPQIPQAPCVAPSSIEWTALSRHQVPAAPTFSEDRNCIYLFRWRSDDIERFESNDVATFRSKRPTWNAWHSCLLQSWKSCPTAPRWDALQMHCRLAPFQPIHRVPDFNEYNLAVFSLPGPTPGVFADMSKASGWPCESGNREVIWNHWQPKHVTLSFSTFKKHTQRITKCKHWPEIHALINAAVENLIPIWLHSRLAALWVITPIRPGQRRKKMPSITCRNRWQFFDEKKKDWSVEEHCCVFLVHLGGGRAGQEMPKDPFRCRLMMQNDADRISMHFNSCSWAQKSRTHSQTEATLTQEFV